MVSFNLSVSIGLVSTGESVLFRKETVVLFMTSPAMIIILATRGGFNYAIIL